MIKIIPVGRRVLVKRDPVKSDTDWGFEFVNSLIEKEQAKQAYGTVIAIADEAYEDVYERKQCGVGDRVIFRAYAGVKASEEDENLILLNDQDVLAIVVEE